MGFNRIGAGFYDQGHAPIPVALAGGQLYMIPSGQYFANTGPYTFIQWYDPGAKIWRNYQTPTNSRGSFISSDGFNWRLANITGGIVGAVVTNGGAGYTNGIYPAGTGTGVAASPTCTFAAGGGTILATGNVIVGGVCGTAPTITSGGTNYTRPPILQVSAPPLGGIPMTMYVSAMVAGVVTGVTVTNMGAGYTGIPTVTVINSPDDTTGAGCVITNGALTLANQVTAITMANNGAGMTAVPAVTFAPASTTAATAIMCWTCTLATWAGPNHATNGNFGLINSTVTAGANTSTNPAITTGMFMPRMGFTAMSTANPTTTTIIDGGLHQVVPNAVMVNNSDGTINASTTTTITQGPAAGADLSYLLPL
jgi:hypothetical protein